MSLNHKIGIGTVQFGMPYGISNNVGQTSDKEVGNILRSALSAEITVIDTASAYGNAEEVLGENDLQPFKIVSKFMPSTNKDGIENQLIQSLSKLKIKKLYGYLAHRPDDLLNDPIQWIQLKRLKDENKITKIGYSLNTVEELIMLLKKNMIPDLVQVPYNYLDNRFRDHLIDLKSRGCEIHTRSAFLQGLFFMNVQQLHSFFLEVKDVIYDLQNEFKERLVGTLLKYVLEQDFIDCVIMGVENAQQLTLNINSVNEAPDISDWTNKVSDLILMPMNWPTK